MRRATAIWRWLVQLFRIAIPLLACIAGGLILFAAGSAPDDVPGWVGWFLAVIAGLCFVVGLDVEHSRAKALEAEKWSALCFQMLKPGQQTKITVTHQYAANREAGGGDGI